LLLAGTLLAFVIGGAFIGCDRLRGRRAADVTATPTRTPRPATPRPAPTDTSRATESRAEEPLLTTEEPTAVEGEGATASPSPAPPTVTPTPTLTPTPPPSEPYDDPIGDEVEALIEELFNLLEQGDPLDDVPGF
jgi:hypothetical protein